MLWILTGILLVLCVRNHFDIQGVARDVRGMARTARKMVREVAKALRRAASDAKKEKETVRAEEPVKTEPMAEAEPQACMAALTAQIPTIDFPKDDPKYDSSKKTRYA